MVRIRLLPYLLWGLICFLEGLILFRFQFMCSTMLVLVNLAPGSVLFGESSERWFALVTFDQWRLDLRLIPLVSFVFVIFVKFPESATAPFSCNV